MKAEPERTKPTRITVTLPPEIDKEATKLSETTGLSLSDLSRQGMIRVLLEMREKGSMQLLQLPALTA